MAKTLLNFMAWFHFTKLPVLNSSGHTLDLSSGGFPFGLEAYCKKLKPSYFLHGYFQ